MKLKIKKIPIATILIAIIFAIGILLFVGAYSKKDALSTYNLWGGKETLVESQNKDIDNDGLRDWEEDLYKTDYLNPDTDGDGYLDGEEINSGHNPLVKAPGDDKIFNPLPLGDKYNITKKVLNSEIIDSILDSYVAQKNEYINDNDINSPDMFAARTKTSTIQEMFLRAIKDAYVPLIEEANKVVLEIPEIFNIEIADKDIKISEDNSTENIKSYLAQVSSILKSDTFFLQQQAFAAISSALKDGDFSKVDSIIKSNEEKLSKAKEIIAPSSWKEIHRKGLELTFLIRNIFISFRDLPNDPLKTYVALDELEKFADRWNQLMEKAIDLANQQGITISL